MSGIEIVIRIFIASAGLAVFLLTIFDTGQKLNSRTRLSVGGSHVQVVDVPPGTSNIKIVIEGHGGGGPDSPGAHGIYEDRSGSAN